MRQIVWAQPEIKDWRGFEGKNYYLDSAKVWALPLTDIETGSPTTFGDVFAKFQGQGAKTDEAVLDLEIQSDVSRLKVKGPSSTLELLTLALELDREGTHLANLDWYYYDHDTCRQDPQAVYSFFLVSGTKIVRESVDLHDHHGSGFDPRLLKTLDDEGYEEAWFNEKAWREARNALCYRKFYSETMTGKLMVARPDQPTLYYYAEARIAPGASVEALLAQVHSGIRQVRLAVWTLVVLTLLIWLTRWR